MYIRTYEHEGRCGYLFGADGFHGPLVLTVCLQPFLGWLWCPYGANIRTSRIILLSQNITDNLCLQGLRSYTSPFKVTSHLRDLDFLLVRLARSRAVDT